MGGFSKNSQFSSAMQTDYKSYVAFVRNMLSSSTLGAGPSN